MGEDNDNSAVWKMIATCLLTGFIGWFTHSFITGGSVTSDTRGTGWSKDQEQRFLLMPIQLDSIYVMGVRERGEIVILLKQILHELELQRHK